VTWPSTQCVINAVIVNYTAGYGSAASSVPVKLRREMLRKIGSFYEHREDLLADQFGQGVMELPGSSLSDYVVYRVRE
jgi:hypothetical protein